MVHPTDPNATYGWIEHDAARPAENTALDEFARAWFDGPGVNYGEWYFPQRLAADVGAAGTLNIGDDDWRMAKFGLRAKFGKDIDVPILAVAFSLVGDTKAFDALRDFVAPIGPGRPAAGTPRTDPRAFQTALYAASFTRRARRCRRAGHTDRGLLRVGLGLRSDAHEAWGRRHSRSQVRRLIEII